MKNNTKLSFTGILFLILTSVIFLSCTSESDIYTEKLIGDIIIGKSWQCISVENKYSGQSVYTCYSDDKLEFLENDSCKLYPGNFICNANQTSVMEGEYEIDETLKTLTLNFQYSLLLEYYVFEITESEIILEHELDGIVVHSIFEAEN